MKLAIRDAQSSADKGDCSPPHCICKWLHIRRGVHRFHSHEAADEWWKEHYLNAYDRAENAGSHELSELREFLNSQDITPRE